MAPTSRPTLGERGSSPSTPEAGAWPRLPLASGWNLASRLGLAHAFGMATTRWPNLFDCLRSLSVVLVSASVCTTSALAQQSMFVGRWDGTIVASGNCTMSGQVSPIPEQSFTGYVMIKSGGGDLLLLATKDFPEGLQFKTSTRDGLIYITAVPGQSIPFKDLTGDLGDMTGTVTVVSGWMAIKEDRLSAMVVQSRHLLQKRDWPKADVVVDCTMTLAYSMDRNTQTAATAQADPSPPVAAAVPPRKPKKGAKGSSSHAGGVPRITNGATYASVMETLRDYQATKMTSGDLLWVTYKTPALLAYPDSGGECVLTFETARLSSCSGCDPIRFGCEGK